MHVKHTTLDLIARHRIGRDALRLIAKLGLAVDTIDDTLAREVETAVA
jgi:hypothetical protein